MEIRPSFRNLITANEHLLGLDYCILSTEHSLLTLMQFLEFNPVSTIMVALKLIGGDGIVLNNNLNELLRLTVYAFPANLCLDS